MEVSWVDAIRVHSYGSTVSIVAILGVIQRVDIKVILIVDTTSNGGDQSFLPTRIVGIVKAGPHGCF